MQCDTGIKALYRSLLVLPFASTRNDSRRAFFTLRPQGYVPCVIDMALSGGMATHVRLLRAK